MSRGSDLIAFFCIYCSSASNAPSASAASSTGHAGTYILDTIVKDPCLLVPSLSIHSCVQMPPPQAAMPQQPQAPMFPVYSSSSSYVPTPQPTVPPAQPQPNMGYTQQPAAATATPQSDSTKFSIPLEYRNSIMTSLPFIWCVCVCVCVCVCAEFIVL